MENFYLKAVKFVDKWSKNLKYLFGHRDLNLISQLVQLNALYAWASSAVGLI